MPTFLRMLIKPSKRGSAPTRRAGAAIVLHLEPRNTAGYGISTEVSMSKPTEQRYPSGPAQVGAQKPGGRSNTQPFYKATTVVHPDNSQGPGKDARQEPKTPVKDAAKPQLRAAKGDDDLMSQEPKKS